MVDIKILVAFKSSEVTFTFVGLQFCASLSIKAKCAEQNISNCTFFEMFIFRFSFVSKSAQRVTLCYKNAEDLCKI